MPHEKNLSTSAILHSKELTSVQMHAKSLKREVTVERSRTNDTTHMDGEEAVERSRRIRGEALERDTRPNAFSWVHSARFDVA